MECDLLWSLYIYQTRLNTKSIVNPSLGIKLHSSSNGAFSITQGSATFWVGRAKDYNLQNFKIFRATKSFLDNNKWYSHK